MLIKKKSLIVATVSGMIICCVLVLTLIGYIAYLELKNRELANRYDEMLQKVNAKFYSRQIAISDLAAVVDDSGPLKGRPVVQGVLKNKGNRDISDLLMKLRFQDMGGAVLYEAVFHPQEPALGSASLTQVPIPYISSQHMEPVMRGGELRFKKILANCPVEICDRLEPSGNGSGIQRRWGGRLEPEILSVRFR
jgi:hypothetical protein